MTPTTLLHAYLAIGVANDMPVVVATEIMPPAHVVAAPLRRRIRIQVTVRAHGEFVWP